MSVQQLTARKAYEHAVVKCKSQGVSKPLVENNSLHPIADIISALVGGQEIKEVMEEKVNFKMQPSPLNFLCWASF